MIFYSQIITAVYQLLLANQMLASGWTQHDDWIKCSIFVTEDPEGNESYNVGGEQELSRAGIWGNDERGMMKKKKGPLEVGKHEQERRLDQKASEQLGLCGFSEKGVGTFLFKQNYSKLFYDPSQQLEVPIKTLALSFYDKSKTLVFILEISNQQIRLKRRYAQELKDIETREENLIFPSPEEAPIMFRKKLWVQLNKLTSSIRVSVGDTANFDTDELFYYNFNVDEGNVPRDTWKTQQNTFLMPKKGDRPLKTSRMENILGRVSYFKINPTLASSAVKRTSQSLNDFLKIKFMNLVRDLSPVLDLNPSILNQKSAHLSVVPPPIEILYNYLKNLSVVNLPEFQAKTNNLLQKQLYSSWYDFQYALHSSLVTPYALKKGRPVGIMNHLFKVKNHKKFTDFRLKLHDFDSRKAMMDYIYQERGGYLRFQLIPSEGLGPGSIAVLEAWPPFCCSPIHNHGEAFGLVKVLSGSIRVENYSDLSFDSVNHPDPYLENDYSQNQYTWLSEESFGIHRLLNLNSQTCLTLQSYYHDKISYEYFEVLKKDGQGEKYIEYFPQNDWKNYLRYPKEAKKQLEQRKKRNEGRQMTQKDWQLQNEELKSLQEDIEYINAVIELYKLDQGADVNYQFYKLALILKDQYDFAKTVDPICQDKHLLPNQGCKYIIYQIKTPSKLDQSISSENNFVLNLSRKELKALLKNTKNMEYLANKKIVFIFSEERYKETHLNVSASLSFIRQLQTTIGFPPNALKLIYFKSQKVETIKYSESLYSVYNKKDCLKLMSKFQNK